MWRAMIWESRWNIGRSSRRRRISSGRSRRWPRRRKSEGRRRGLPLPRRTGRHGGTCGKAPYLLRGFPRRGRWRTSFLWPSRRRVRSSPPLGRQAWRRARPTARPPLGASVASGEGCGPPRGPVSSRPGPRDGPRADLGPGPDTASYRDWSGDHVVFSRSCVATTDPCSPARSTAPPSERGYTASSALLHSLH
jgi:hypothetical protein